MYYKKRLIIFTFFIEKLKLLKIYKQGDLVTNRLTVVQNKTSGEITLSKIDHWRTNRKVNLSY